MWRLQEKGTRPEWKWLGEEAGITEEKRGEKQSFCIFSGSSESTPKSYEVDYVRERDKGRRGGRNGDGRERRQ